MDMGCLLIIPSDDYILYFNDGLTFQTKKFSQHVVAISERERRRGVFDDGVPVRQRGPRRHQAVRHGRHHARSLRRMQETGKNRIDILWYWSSFTHK